MSHFFSAVTGSHDMILLKKNIRIFSINNLSQFVTDVDIKGSNIKVRRQRRKQERRQGRRQETSEETGEGEDTGNR